MQNTPGSIPIGIIEFYRALAESFKNIVFQLTFVLIEAEKEFLDIAEKMITLTTNYLPSNLSIVLEAKLCEKVSLNNNFNHLDKFDLVTMSNFLTSNEGENQKIAVSLIMKFKNNIKEDGSLLIVEPGEENSCKSLKNIRNEVINKNILNMFSPCVGIWEEKINYNCACFSMVRCYWQIPRIYEYLITKGLSKAKRANVPFNYVLLRVDNIRKYNINPKSKYYTKVNELKDNIGRTVNVIARLRTVIYHDKRVDFSLCDGSCSFSRDSKAVWVDILIEQLIQNGITFPLISAEKITLKKVLVKLNGEKINLEINENSRIIIDY